MIGNKTTLTVKIGERIYQLLCDSDSPLGEAHDALCQMKKHVVDKIQSMQTSEDAPKEPKQEDA